MSGPTYVYNTKILNLFDKFVGAQDVYNVSGSLEKSAQSAHTARLQGTGRVDQNIILYSSTFTTHTPLWVPHLIICFGCGFGLWVKTPKKSAPGGFLSIWAWWAAAIESCTESVTCYRRLRVNASPQGVARSYYCLCIAFFSIM